MYCAKSVSQDNVVPKEIMYKLRGPNVNNGQSTNACDGRRISKEKLEADLKKSLLLIDEVTKSIKTIILEQRSKIVKVVNTVKEPAASGKVNKSKTPMKGIVGPYFRRAVKKNFYFTLKNSVSRASAQFSYTLISLPTLNDKIVVKVGKLFKPIVDKLLIIKSQPTGLTIEYVDGTELSVPGHNVAPAHVLEILGGLIGLYDSANIQFYISHKWLEQSVNVIKGTVLLESFVRAVNVHLGHHDLFSFVNQITLADIVVYHVIRNVSALPSNAETFVQHVENALSTA